MVFRSDIDYFKTFYSSSKDGNLVAKCKIKALEKLF